MKSRLCLLAGLALALWAGPVPADAQGVVRGAEEGAARGNRAAGPVGGAVGGAVGGVVGGVKGVLGIPQETRPLRRAKRSKSPRRARADRS